MTHYYTKQDGVIQMSGNLVLHVTSAEAGAPWKRVDWGKKRRADDIVLSVPPAYVELEKESEDD